MAQPLINVGAAVGDGTGELGPRGWLQKVNRLPIWDAILNAGSGDYTGTTEAKITACVADAVVQGKPAIWIPKSMQPFTGTLVTSNAAVLQMREGGPLDGSMDLDAYGVTGDGVTDVTALLQSIENLRPAWRTLRGVAGKSYALNANTGATLLKFKSAGIIDFSGATLLYTNAANLTTGGDGNGLGVISFLADDITFLGTIDCNLKARYGITPQDTKKRFRLQCKIQNTLETSGIWSGLYGAASSDITGVAVTTRARNIYGTIERPNAPLCDAASTIIQHGDCTADLKGDDTVVGNSTGLAFVCTNQIAPAYCVAKTETRGVPAFGFAGIGNTFLGDLFVHDIGLNAAEFGGTSQANSDANKTPQNKRIGPIIKGLPSSGVTVGIGCWFNDASDGTAGPNVWIDGGGVAGAGLIDLNPVPNAGGVSATAGGRLVERIVLPSEAVLVSGVDAAQGNSVLVTLTAARLVGAPLNPRNGQKLKFTFIQGGAGAFAVTWNAVFKKIWSDTGNATGARSSIEYEYDGTNWNQVAAQAPYV